jgi:hypothetical protein
LTTCPNLKHLDLRKITPEMRDSNGTGVSVAAIKEEKSGSTPHKKSDDGGKTDNANISTDISPDKPPVTTIPNTNTDDISPEGLLEVIS